MNECSANDCSCSSVKGYLAKSADCRRLGNGKLICNGVLATLVSSAFRSRSAYASRSFLAYEYVKALMYVSRLIDKARASAFNVSRVF